MLLHVKEAILANVSILFKKNTSLLSYDELIAHSPHLSFLTEEDLFSFNADLSYVWDKRWKLENSIGAPFALDIKNQKEKFLTDLKKQGIKQNPLARAIAGKSKNVPLSVIDATAGQLSDALFLHVMGHKVHAFERAPLSQILIADSLKYQPLADFIFYPQNVIEKEDLIKQVDVVYFDPMYQYKNTKAAPKKGMQIFRKLTGEDKDQEEVLLKLLNLAKKVVLKRAPKAPILFSPHHSIESKTVRFDVYQS